MFKIKFTLIIALFLFLCPTYAFAAQDQGVFYQNAKLTGKIIMYNSDRELFIVYGNVEVRERERWVNVEANKFIRVSPSVGWVKTEIEQYLSKGVILEGSYNAFGSQMEEEFRATKAGAATSFPQPKTEWIGFGSTLQTLSTAKFNINEVTDFVNVLAAGRDALAGMNIEKSNKEYIIGNAMELAKTIRYPGSISQRATRERMVKWWNSYWNFKWFVEQNINTYNAAKKSVGGAAFYTGQLGVANILLSGVPTIRPDIANFMRNAPTGGDFKEVSGPAVFFANIKVQRALNPEGKLEIVKVTASGPLFEEPKQLANISNGVNSQTWRLEGWDKERATVLENKQCWLSGNRVLKYEYDNDGNKKLVDYYFNLNKSLTINEFNSMLDLQRELFGEGGF